MKNKLAKIFAVVIIVVLVALLLSQIQISDVITTLVGLDLRYSVAGSILCVLIISILFGFLLVALSLDHMKHLKHMVDISSRYRYIILGFLLLVGFYLRIHCLAYVPFGNPPHTVDELATIYAAIGVAQHGSPVLPSGWVYERAILNTYLIAVAFKIFGINEFSARFVSIIFGCLMIPLVYLCARDITSDDEYQKGVYIYIGLIAAFLITFSEWEIYFARQARMYAQFQFLYLLTVYLFYRGLKNNNNILLLLSLLSFYLTFLTHRLSLTFVPVALIYLIYYKEYYKKEKILKLLKTKYILILLFISFIIAYFVFAAITLIPKQIPEGLSSSVFFYIKYYLLTHSVISILIIIGIVLPCICKKYKINDFFHPYLLLNIIIPFLVLSIYPWQARHYSLYIFPIFILLASHILVTIFIASREIVYKSDFRQLLRVALTFLIIAVLLSQPLIAFDELQSKPSWNKKDSADICWKATCSYVNTNMKENDVIVTNRALPTLYFLGKADYWFRQNNYKKYTYIDSNGDLREIYAGTIVLKDYETFIELIEHSHGWVIADTDRLEGYYTDPAVRDYIKGNMLFHPEASDRYTQVYSW